MASSRAATRSVVVAHDYLTQFGGAERVALELAVQLRAERIITATYRPEQTFRAFQSRNVETVHSHIVDALSSDPRKALPFLAHAWSAAEPVDADVAICSSSGWSHALPVTADTRKIVYCHNPARWLYQREDYVRGHSTAVRAALAVLSPGLKRWDSRAAHSADAYIANSSIVAERIRRTYGIRAEVVNPPVSVDIDGARQAVDGLDAGFFLTVARPRGYKGTRVMIDAFARMPERQLVIVGSGSSAELPPNVVSLGEVKEEELRWLYANAQALTSVSHEDFGLTPVEANAFGTPALVLRAGGFLDSTDEGISGSFIEGEESEDVIRAVTNFSAHWSRSAIVAHAALFSAAAFGAHMSDAVDAVLATTSHPAREAVVRSFPRAEPARSSV